MSLILQLNRPYQVIKCGTADYLGHEFGKHFQQGGMDTIIKCSRSLIPFLPLTFHMLMPFLTV